VKKYLLIILAVAVIAGMLLSSCAEKVSTTSVTATTTATVTKTAETKTLTIGYAVDLSGPISVYYISQEREILELAQIYNENGGITIAGQKYFIKLAGEDAKSTADGGAEAATRLVYDKGVKFVVGPFGFEAAASTPIFEENKVININTFPTWSPGELNKDTPYSFAGNGGPMSDTLIMIQALMQEYPAVKKIVILAGDDGTSAFIEPKYQAWCAEHGLTILNNNHMVLFPQTMEDLSPIAAKVDLMKPDAVVEVSSQPVQAGSFIKAFRALGNNAPFTFAGHQGTQWVIDALGPTASDVLTVGTSIDHPGSALHAELIKRIPETELASSGAVCNSLIVLLEILKKSPSLNPDDVKATWESTSSIDGLFGPVFFGGDLITGGLHNHVISQDALVQRVINGQSSVVGWVSSGRVP
jgi:branched-chain amino acid transport system substrate-binding protein